jgi:hypothetical protein
MFKERIMEHQPNQPQTADNGIAFTVRVDSVDRDCIISNDALAKLSGTQSDAHDPMQTFHAFEAKIHGVARRLVTANVPGTPLQLGPESFH